ncbi:MAG: type IX secretion system sortase PorU, partial [Bacteroidota bacterium]
MLPLRITLFAVWVLLLAIGGATTVRAQEGTLRTVDDDPGGRTLELTIDWPASLSQVVDSLEGRVLDEAAAGLLSGGWWSWSEQVELPSLASPSVRLVSADYDEVRIAEPGSVSEELGQLLEMLGTPVVYDAGVGLERRRPVASIAFRPIHFDRESGVLKRYRRITAAVRYSEPSGGTLGRASLVTRNPHLSVSRSALADGLVFKIPIRDEGVYRISHTMLQQMLSGTGMEAADVRPSEIKLLGNGGAPLPAIAGDPRPADLIENPVVVDGGADGSFDAGDGILFFARGASGWEYNPDDGWQHYLNPFSTVNYYFLKIGGEEGRRVQVQSFDSVTNPEIVSTVEGRHFVQPDEMMWAKDGGSGLTWLSRRIQSTGEFKILDQFEAPGLVPGTVRYEARVAIQSNPRTAVRFYHGNEMVGRILASRSIGSGSYTPVAALSDGMFEHVVSDDRLNLAMRLESAQNSPSAALRWLRVFYAKRLVARSGFLSFSTPAGAAGSFEFRLSGFSEAPVVWHVRDGAAVRALEVQPFDGGYRVRTSVTDPAFPHELVAFTPSAITSLESALDSWDLSFVWVPPQNLHGSGGYPSFVIITPAEFQSSAERLAEHRREQGLDVRVVDIQQIYNEFSGGLPDMRAVRDYLKFLYDRGPVSEPALRYALLFGDGHYNFRGLSDGGETPQLDNHIFPYQTEETLDPIRSYTSDDYFGLLDDIEGAWPYATESTAAPSGYPVERVDIGIGRLTVQTSQEAEVVVSKLIDYDDVRSRGAWRGMYTMLADDGPTGLSGTTNDADLHTQNADAVATLIEASFPKVNLRKIYAQSYQREFLGAWRIPSARRDVLSALNDGTLVFNYSGHGNTEALMQEEVFTRSDVARLTNQDRLSIFVTATCDFGRWDLQDRQSTAEELLLHAGGGSVALFTTVRVVYTSPNINSLNVGLNRELNRTMFSADDDGRARRLGDILRITKNTAVGLQGNNRKFNLLGDPTTRIGIPAAEVAIESVNEVDIRQESAALRALERIVVRGSVRNLQGDLDPGFNGTVDLTVFDASRRVPVVDQRWMPNEYYTVREDLIWRGRANVV